MLFPSGISADPTETMSTDNYWDEELPESNKKLFIDKIQFEQVEHIYGKIRGTPNLTTKIQDDDGRVTIFERLRNVINKVTIRIPGTDGTKYAFKSNGIYSPTDDRNLAFLPPIDKNVPIRTPPGSRSPDKRVPRTPEVPEGFPPLSQAASSELPTTPLELKQPGSIKRAASRANPAAAIQTPGTRARVGASCGVPNASSMGANLPDNRRILPLRITS